MTPMTVPSSPTNGAALSQVVPDQRRRALNRATHGVEHFFTAESAGVILLELIFLQACQNHLREVAVLEVLVGREGDGILQTAILEVLGHLRRK
jgi:hypothetical protein